MNVSQNTISTSTSSWVIQQPLVTRRRYRGVVSRQRSELDCPDRGFTDSDQSSMRGGATLRFGGAVVN